MDLPSIVTEAQSLRATIRDLRSVILTDKERLERHEGELTTALDRVGVLRDAAQKAFAAIAEPIARLEDVAPCGHEHGVLYDGPGSEARCVDCAAVVSPFGEPSQVAAE